MPRFRQLRTGDRKLLCALTKNIPAWSSDSFGTRSSVRRSFSSGMPHIITSWIHGNKPGFSGVNHNDYVRIWWDPDPDGIHQDYCLASRVHFIPDSGCWRFQVFTGSGARHGKILSLSDPESVPYLALERSDSITELFSIVPRDYKKVFEVKHRSLTDDFVHTPCDPPWVPELQTMYGHRILRWSGIENHRNGSYERYARYIVHSNVTISDVPQLKQQGLLVERASHVPAATVSFRDGVWSWTVSLQGSREENGRADSAFSAFDSAESALLELGAIYAPDYIPELQTLIS